MCVPAPTTRSRCGSKAALRLSYVARLMVVSSDWKSTWLNPWVTANDTDAFNAGTNLSRRDEGREWVKI